MQISDFLVEKYKNLMYLKKLKRFLKSLLWFFADSHEKKFRGRYFLAGTGG